MDNASSFWLGLALAVPIGIGVNLATPYLQVRLARYSTSWQRRNKKRLLRDRAMASLLADDHQALTLRIGRAVINALRYAFTATSLFVSMLLFIGLTRVHFFVFATLAIVSATAGLVQFIQMLNHMRRLDRV